jgi:hypothetical protein
MKTQAEMLRSLRAPEEVEPAAGFYARVLQRIEEQTIESIWAVFVNSPIGNRLVYASLTLALVLGSYVIAQESRDGEYHKSRVVAQNVQFDAVFGDSQQQRDAVLVNFVSQ